MDELRVQVAADLFGTKENLNVWFQHLPSSVQEVESEVRRLYSEEVRVMCPEGVAAPQFTVDYMQFFEDEGWVDLVSVAQLYDDMQIFVFQPKSIVHSDNQDLIPVAKEPVAARRVVVSPQKVRPQARGGGNGSGVITQLELEDIYMRLDREGCGVALDDIRQVFTGLGVELSPTTVASLFSLPPPPNDDDYDSRLITFEGFTDFSANHPSLLSAIRQHLVDPESIQPDDVMAEVVSDQQKKLDMLQKAHREALARKQREAVDRLTKGRSSKMTEYEVKKKKKPQTPRGVKKPQQQQQQQPQPTTRRSTSPSVTRRSGSVKAFGRSVTQQTTASVAKQRSAASRTVTPVQQKSREQQPTTATVRRPSVGRQRKGYSAVPQSMLGHPVEQKSMSPQRVREFVEVQPLVVMPAPAPTPLHVPMPSTEAYKAVEEEFNRVTPVREMTGIEMLRKGVVPQSPLLRDHSVSQARSASVILSPGGSTIPMPVAAPHVAVAAPPQDLGTLPPPRSVSHSIPLPSPSPAYQPSVTPASPSGSTRRWYPNLVSPAIP